MTGKGSKDPAVGDGVSLTLYIGGSHPTSALAAEALEAALETREWLRARLQVIDVFDEPRAALGAGVVATPSLLAADGERRLWMIGDFEDKAELDDFLKSFLAGMDPETPKTDALGGARGTGQ